MSSPQIPFSAHPLFWLALALASGVCLAARAGAAWPVLCLCGAVSVGAAVRAWGGRGTRQATWLLLLAFVSVGALLVTLERRNEAATQRARRLYETGVIPSGGDGNRHAL